MELAGVTGSGMALGAWGAVQATAAGVAVAMSGAIRDGVGSLAMDGSLGLALQQQSTGYSVVYHTEIFLLFVTLIALGPLVRVHGQSKILMPDNKFGLAQHPG
jgi:BCD family chlorophyll transporter-like MFS transporter